MAPAGPATDALADLHRHLDGSLRRETLAELLGRPVPDDLPFRPGMGLAAALERFALTLSVLQTLDAVKRDAPAFTIAERAGVGRTVHAGEGRPPAEIREAIEHLHAQRIGHGTTLLDDPSVVDLVLARGVTIEACPTSNVQTAAIPALEAHPLPRWLDLGVRACINTDNTLLSATTSPEEHRRARTLPGMTDTKLAQAIAHGHAARFTR